MSDFILSETGNVLSQLLEGKFICRISNEQAFEFLQTPENRDKIDYQLRVLNRCLTSGCDGEIYYCSYQDLGGAEHKVLSEQFGDIASSLLPLVEWLVLVQESIGGDTPLSAGNHIRLNELQTAIEDTPAFREQLTKISQYRLFGSNSSQVDGQLKQVFKRLVEQGYLIRPNSEKQIYIACAKIDYLFEIIRFIDETEDLSLEQRASDSFGQENLL
ncbi:hypothetical protein DBZ36_02780 [Alginatibacterium sediminis]|uniref:DUF4194 domain-containing protein n=1 Tax=Alginatibacterium sediminis TaxID=2164068 RepID=A0A420EJP2_9ALTE|nr:hypothetical protein [Alginatibacterium sediminis]RKF20883.1 hypothetical protein DBZ36_02780 [Alginatibacterium sediminis]